MDASGADQAETTAGVGDIAVVGDIEVVAHRARVLPLYYKNLAFFAQDISDGSTIKRVSQFLSHGFTVTVLGFRRDRYNIDFKPTWPHILLGYTQDRRYLRRIRTIFAAIPVIWAERRYLARTSVFYARNLDQLALALIVRTFTNPAATIVYEVLDIQPILARKGIVAAALRLIERVCLRRVRYLVLSSPGFYRYYYAAIQGYQGAWLLLENKLSEPIRSAPGLSVARAVQPARRRHDGLWTVGYFGLIRGQATVDLIVRLAQRLVGRVHFVFRGVFTTIDEAQFRSTLAAHQNISYGGRFDNPHDLAELYGSVDFAWAIDLENVDNNSRWLLPCRLYEAGYFGVPCLAAHGFELGNRVERLAIGWAFDMPIEDEIVHFFENVTPAQYEEKRAALIALPDSAFVAGADLDALCRVLGDPEWASAKQTLRDTTERQAA